MPRGAHWAAKTHCPAGHPYDAANTGRDKRGYRFCITCNRERARAQRQRPGYREDQRVYTQKWRAANRDRLIAKRRASYDRASAREKYMENQERERDRWLWKAHGLRPEGFAALWDAQDGKCYLCDRPMTQDTSDIDHDHSCCPRGRSCRTCRRGLAHKTCNKGIGMFLDNPAIMRRAADALESALLAVAGRMAQDSAPITLF